MSKKASNKNRNYVFEERYLTESIEEKLRFTKELIELNRINARFSVTVGNRFIILHVYCKTNHSRSYDLCDTLGYDEI